jgi:TolB-like protein/DNA-binding winged helix-turn-helix (wHTH) protein/Tfp pilus assembly protein PilF
MPTLVNSIFCVGDVHVDPALDEIRMDGVTVKLEPRTMRLLVCLAERAGQVVSVDELLDLIWKDVVVSPDSVYRAVASLRRALGDDAKEPTYIANVTRRGYRLVAPISSWVAPTTAQLGNGRVPSAVEPVSRDLTVEIPQTDPNPSAPPATPPPSWAASQSVAAHRPPVRLAITIIAVASLATVLGYFAVEHFLTSDRAATVAGATAPSPVVSNSSVAVLPFLDLSEKRDQEYFADGMAEELIDMLSQVPELQVPARTSSFYFKGKQASLHDIAASLGVSHVLEGSVRKSGNTVRVTAQLIYVADGVHVWSHSYDGSLDDIFKLQDEIAQSVIMALRASLLDKPLVSADAATNGETYSLYLQARAMNQRHTEADNVTALAYLRRAVQLDPAFAPAWASIADVLVDDFKFFAARPYKEVRAEVYQAADKALAINPQLAVAHIAKARLLYEIDWDINAADTEVSSALGSTPRNSQALRLASEIASTRGQFARELSLARRSVANDPLDARGFARIAAAEVANGNLVDAMAWFRKALELNPTGSGIHYQLASILVSRGDATRALEEAKLEPDASFREASLALAYDGLGFRKEADESLNIVIAKYSMRAAYQVVEILSSRGDLNGAFNWLHRAYVQHDTGLLKMNSNPLLKNLRNDPRFEEFRRRTGLSDSSPASTSSPSTAG